MSHLLLWHFLDIFLVNHIRFGVFGGDQVNTRSNMSNGSWYVRNISLKVCWIGFDCHGHHMKTDILNVCSFYVLLLTSIKRNNHRAQTEWSTWSKRRKIRANPSFWHPQPGVDWDQLSTSGDLLLFYIAHQSKCILIIFIDWKQNIM